jgi:hypothetical protein
MADEPEQQPEVRERIGQRPWLRSAALIGGGLVVGGILAGTLSANAATGDPAVATYSYGQEGNRNSTPVTSDTDTRVTDAVKAGYPDATIQRVETDSDGVYQAYIIDADGQQRIVQVGQDFSITGTRQLAH